MDPLSMMAAEEEAADEVDQENTDDTAAKGGLEGKKAEAKRMMGHSEAEELWREIKAEMAAAGAAGNNTAMIRIR